MINKSNMPKNILFAAFLSAAVFYMISPLPGHCVTLLTADEAIARLFPESTATTPLLVKASSVNILELKKNLGSRNKSEAGKNVQAAVLGLKEYTFYICRNEGAFLGTVIILEGPGKWGPIKFAVAMDAGGAVSSTVVMEYRETRGRPIASRNFLKQFKGKSGADPVALGVDIHAVSGATVSSEAACAIMKVAVALYTETHVYDAIKKSGNQI